MQLQNVDSRGGCASVGVGVYGNSTSQLLYEPETTLENKVYLKK